MKNAANATARRLAEIAREHAAQLDTVAGRRQNIIDTLAVECERDGMSPFTFADLLVLWESFRYRMDKHGFVVDDHFDAFSLFTDDIIASYRFHAAA